MGRLRRFFGRTKPTAIMVDGPNVLREEFTLDFGDLRETREVSDSSTIDRVYLDEHASPGLIRAAETNGFEVVITSGDVDVKLAVDATELVVAGRIDTILLVSRDADFKPVLEMAARAGIRTVVAAPVDHGRSEALVNAADEAILLEPRHV